MKRALVPGMLVWVAFQAGCTSRVADPVDASGARDAQVVDSGSRDAASDSGSSDGGATPEDAGAELDSGADDAGAMDGGATDAGAADAGTSADASMDGGALGSAPRAGDLVIMEIQGNPQMATDELAEYIELLNVSGRSLDLAGVELTFVSWSGGEPVASVARHTIATSVVVPAGSRVLLGRSSGGYFGTATPDYVYGGFVFANGDTFQNRVRLMVPGWDGTEPPAAADIVDEVRTEAGAFDNVLRGRALQLDPAAVPVPTAASNDDPADWCHAAAVASLEYWSSNWGTPRALDRCM